MNKKGFTLVEILAIVVLIGVIAVAAIPSMTKEISSNDTKTTELNRKNIESAAKLYVSKYYADKVVENKVIRFTLNDLKNDGLISINTELCDDDDINVGSDSNKAYIEFNRSSYKVYNFSSTCYSGGGFTANSARTYGTTRATSGRFVAISDAPTTAATTRTVNSCNRTKDIYVYRLNLNKSMCSRTVRGSTYNSRCDSYVSGYRAYDTNARKLRCRCRINQSNKNCGSSIIVDSIQYNLNTYYVVSANCRNADFTGRVASCNGKNTYHSYSANKYYIVNNGLEVEGSKTIDFSINKANGWYYLVGSTTKRLPYDYSYGNACTYACKDTYR